MIVAALAVALQAAPLPADLRRAADAYDAAQVSGDGRQLERLLADDYLLIDGAGAPESKAALIRDFTDPAFHLKPFEVDHPVTQVWTDGALLGGEVRLQGSNAGKPFEAHTRFVDVWRRRAGRWQVIFTQVTRIRPGD